MKAGCVPKPILPRTLDWCAGTEESTVGGIRHAAGIGDTECAGSACPECSSHPAVRVRVLEQVSFGSMAAIFHADLRGLPRRPVVVVAGTETLPVWRVPVSSATRAERRFAAVAREAASCVSMARPAWPSVALLCDKMSDIWLAIIKVPSTRKRTSRLDRPQESALPLPVKRLIGREWSPPNHSGPKG